MTGQVVSLVAPDSVTDEKMTEYLVSMAPKVRNGIVMVGRPMVNPVNFNPTATRRL